MISKQDHANWRQWGSAIVSDALRTCGKPFQAMDGGIHPIAPSMQVVGPAFTVRCYPGATWALEKALEEAAPGDVLVVDGAGASDVILMGGLLSKRAQTRGLAGAVIDGAVRDTADIEALGFAMFARHVCPRGGTFAEIGETQTIVCCGGRPVQPGDWIVGDRDGVTIVPQAMIDAVAEEAGRIHDREQVIGRELAIGKSLPEAAAAAKAAAANNGH